MLIFVSLMFLAVVIAFIYTKNKQAKPDLLASKPEISEEIRVNGDVESTFNCILQFGQTSDYKIDYVNTEGRQLILNYTAKIGEQTNGTFFPIWVTEIDADTSNVCVGTKDKAISFGEEKNALAKLIPKLQAALNSVQASGGSSGSRDVSKKGTWEKARTLSDDEYRIYLVKNYQVEKNDTLGKVICQDKLFDTVDLALEYADKLDAEKHLEKAKQALIPRVVSQGSIGSTGLWRFKEFSSGEVIAESSSGEVLRFPTMSEAKEYFDN